MRRILCSRLAPLVLAPLFAVACADSNPTPQSGESTPVGVIAPIQVDYAGLPTSNPDDPRTAVGVTATVDTTISFQDVDAATLTTDPLPAGHGALSATGTGFSWTAVVAADGASALRLDLTDLYLPRDASLTVYNDQGEVAGPYTSRDNGELWTTALMSDRVTLQLDYDGADTAQALDAIHFTIANAGVLDDRFLVARYQHTEALARSFCSYNEACVENAACATIPQAVQAAQKAIALIVFSSGGGMYICSGGLIADTDTNSVIPYFLTANHCISKGREAKSVQTYFDFLEDSCNSPTCTQYGETVTTVGSTLVASNRTGDYTLLQLSENPPGANYLPFNHDEIAFNDGVHLYRLSHPSGAPQAYSEHIVDTSYGTCTSWPRGGWIYSRDVVGATEGGSSGSPVLNAAGEVVGQLSGGCGTNINDVCDAASNATVDGAMAAYWPDVAPYLDPQTSTCEPSPEVCDGIDNDCNGVIDDGDVCGGGGGECIATGDSCSDDAECCSNKCKGKPGARTCH